MLHPRLSDAEIDHLGQKLYEQDIRKKVETAYNIGKQIVIDVESGDYEIDDDGLTASRRLLARHPGAALYGARIGYDAVYALGGVLSPTGPRLQRSSSVTSVIPGTPA